MKKICTNCKDEKEIEEFRKNKNTADGYEGQCKTCRKEKQKKSYKEQNWNERKQERRRLNPEIHKQYQAQWRENNREKYREYNRRWRNNSLELNLYKGAKARASRKGLDFNIDISDIIIPEYCPILGTKLEKTTGYNFENKKTAPSIDRKDSSKGYIKENVWVISALANIMKNNASMEELKRFSQNILKLIENDKLIC